MQTAGKGLEMNKAVAAYFPEEKVPGDYKGNMILTRRDGAMKIKTGEDLDLFSALKLNVCGIELQLQL